MLDPQILSHSFISLHAGYFCMLFFLLLSGDFFFKINLFKKSFRNTIRESNSLDPDQARHFVRSDLGPNCLQRLSADDKSCH